MIADDCYSPFLYRTPLIYSYYLQRVAVQLPYRVDTVRSLHDTCFTPAVAIAATLSTLCSVVCGVQFSVWLQDEIKDEPRVQEWISDMFTSKIALLDKSLSLIV